jgi:hypothetical protein
LGSVSIANYTVAGLREIGILDELILTKEGLVRYPGGLSAEAPGD